MDQIQIHFSHANGFPARCYTPLFDRLGFPVTFVERIGHGQFPIHGNFEPAISELILEVEARHTRPVVAMGHSTGGILVLMAALKRPDLFTDLVLLDPMLLCAAKRWGIALSRRLGLRYYIGPVRGSKRRRDRFRDLDEVRRRYEKKPVFQDFHPECFESYLAHGFQPTADGQGVEPAFSKHVESEIFASTQTHAPRGLTELRGLLLYGRRSRLFSAMDVRWWQRKMIGFRAQGHKGGHLFPFEDPQGVADLIRDHLLRRSPDLTESPDTSELARHS